MGVAPSSRGEQGRQPFPQRLLQLAPVVLQRSAEPRGADGEGAAQQSVVAQQFSALGFLILKGLEVLNFAAPRLLDGGQG